MSDEIFSDHLVTLKTCDRSLSFSSIYLKDATLFGYVKSMCCSTATSFKNSYKSGLFVFTVLIIFTTLLLLYYPANNIAHAGNPFTLLNPFTTTSEVCNDGIDNDGDGFVDDNCGTLSLKVTKDPLGVVTNISSICHEDCDLD